MTGFREFLLKTNAMALAVGVIIGVALGAVVNSLVDDIIMPPVGVILTHDSGWRIEVTAGNERRVTRLRLHPPAPETSKA